MTHLANRWRTLGLIAVCLVALVVPARTPSSAAPYCNKATGITATKDGKWVVTSWDKGRVYDADWNRTDDIERKQFKNNIYGIASGPNGSLWTLETSTDEWASVSRRNAFLDIETMTVLRTTRISNGSRTIDRDLAFDGRWLVLSDGTVPTFDPDWTDPDRSPAIQRSVPENATGMTATDDTLAFITGSGTVHVYDVTPDGYEREIRFSVALNGTAVDDHPGPNGT